MPQPDRPLTPGILRDHVASFLAEHPQHRITFVQDPADALSRHLGISTGGANVRVLEDTADTIHFVVPPDPNELGDEDLERVAGGARGATYFSQGWPCKWQGP